jgi:hypothetical protein
MLMHPTILKILMMVMPYLICTYTIPNLREVYCCASQFNDTYIVAHEYMAPRTLTSYA